MAAKPPSAQAALIRFGSRRERRRAAAIARHARRLAAPGALLLTLALIGPLEAQTGRAFTDPNSLGSPLSGSRDEMSAPGVSAPTGAGRAPGPAAVTSGTATQARPPVNNNAPVTFTADEVEYDRERGIVTARGRVEAWQNERILRADTFIYDRNNGIATVRGNVQLMEADGQVLFAEEAELGEGFREGVLTGVPMAPAAPRCHCRRARPRAPSPPPSPTSPGWSIPPATSASATRQGRRCGRCAPAPRRRTVRCSG